MSATIYVLILMLGASLIGFAIAWVMKQPAFIKLKNTLLTTENKLQSLESEHSNLTAYANDLQKEKEQLLKANDKLTDKLLSLTNTSHSSTAQKRTKKSPPQPPKICSTGSCLLYTSPSPRDQRGSRMPSSA